MKYTKPALTFVEQAELLLKRGLIADREKLIRRLKRVSYYRLSGYWHKFQKPDDTFVSGTDFETIWNHYTFDRQLRLLVLDAIERFEVATRTAFINEFGVRYGAFGYLDNKNLPHMPIDRYEKIIERFREEVAKSNEQFILHFRKTYGAEHDAPPIWMGTELMAFGTLLSFYRGVPSFVKNAMAASLRVDESVYFSWLRSMNGIRNICAHHGRFWDRVFDDKPKIPLKDPLWHNPVEIDNARAWGILSILRYCMRAYAPHSKWHERFDDLLKKYPMISTAEMGFPDNWRESPIWK